METYLFRFCTIFTEYLPTSGQDDNEVDNVFQQLQVIIDILVVQEDWNAKVERATRADLGGGGAYFNPTTMQRQMVQISDS